MKKTFTNGEIFTIANVLFGGRENEGFVKKGNLKITMSVRHALKFNYIAIQNANKVIEEMINDIIKEIMDDFIEQNKATKNDDGCKVKDEYQNEFILIQQHKLNELSFQTVELDLYTYSESDFEKYANLNDGKLTNSELDVLELFVENSEETE